MAESPAGECLFALYLAAGEDEHHRAVLDHLVEKAELGWRCEALLAGDEGLPCEYMNVPLISGRDTGRCANCDTPRPKPVAI